MNKLKNLGISFLIVLVGLTVLYHTSFYVNELLYGIKKPTTQDVFDGIGISLIGYTIIGLVWFFVYLIVIDVTHKPCKKPCEDVSDPITPNLQKVLDITQHITMSVFGIVFKLYVAHDKSYENGRIYLQVKYDAPCTKTGEVQEWNGRKWYLSEHMTEDEVVKTAWCAFEAAVKHEVMEGFKFDGVIVFNPHVNFRALLEVSGNEIKRD